jgi:hypothetical protein
MDAADNLVPHDFVFLGKVTVVGGLGIKIQLLNEDGTLGDIRVYKHNRKLERTIGGIYAGAKFDADHASGLDRAGYKGQWHDKDQIQDWRIKSENVERIVRTKKLEGDAKRVNEIDLVMASLRKTYDNYRRIGDYAGMEALEAAVVRSLRKGP